MASYCWYQITGGKEAWKPILAEQKQKVIEESNPTFMTVLDATQIPDEDSWGREDYAKMKYSGPLYFDWDSDDIEQTIPPFQEFLKKLEEEKVNLGCIRLYATGGRGFHCEIPESVVNPKPSKAGTTLLPYIYRDIAMELVTDCMDMKIYTARKGRMWRMPNVERVNKEGEKTGRFKVSITLEEALTMTPEMYVELTSRPRRERERESPTPSSFFNTLFTNYSLKVVELAKAAAKHKGDEALLKRFNGEFPPTLLRIMAGEDLAPNLGFHKIAMQLAITANALNKSAEDLVNACEGLVQSHSSDSQRYNSPRKRKEELRRLHEYTKGCLVYTYSKGGIKSLVAAGTPTNDLDSPAESQGVGSVQDDEDPQGTDEAEKSDELDRQTSDVEAILLEGVFVRKSGVFRITSEGPKPLSNLGFLDPCRLVDTDDGVQVGLEVTVFSDKRKLGRHSIPTSTFKSRAALNDYCLGRAGAFAGSDTQATAVHLALSRKAMKNDRTVYSVHKEGLDLVTDPTQSETVRRHAVWVSPEGVRCVDDVDYRFSAKIGTGATIKTDLHLANPMMPTEQARTWVRSLLTMNDPVVVGLMVGWFVSCFHKQFYQAAYSQFPLLHPNGTAGSGKTLTTKLLAKMFFNHNPPIMIGASHNASTSFSLKAALTTSASIPVIIDEYKPSELASHRHEFLLQHFRMLYNQSAGATGGIGRGTPDSSFRDITSYTYSAPTVYLGESQEMQTAVVQRSISVPFNPTASAMHTQSFNNVVADPNISMAAALGSRLMARSLRETVESRREALDPIRDELRKTMAKGTHDRQIYNLAVVIAGLGYLSDTLNEIFGDEFDDAIQNLCATLVDTKDEVNTYAMAEYSKVLNDMSMLTRMDSGDGTYIMREGFEYVVGDGWVEILLKEAFVKYFSWCHKTGFKPLYPTAEGFITSLAKSPAVDDIRCFDSVLRTSAVSKIFRLNLDRMSAEGVELFKSKSLA